LEFVFPGTDLDDHFIIYNEMMFITQKNGKCPQIQTLAETPGKDGK
jgi:hypothetical protein